MGPIWIFDVVMFSIDSLKATTRSAFLGAFLGIIDGDR